MPNSYRSTVRLFEFLTLDILTVYIILSTNQKIVNYSRVERHFVFENECWLWCTATSNHVMMFDKGCFLSKLVRDMPF